MPPTTGGRAPPRSLVGVRRAGAAATRARERTGAAVRDQDGAGGGEARRRHTGGRGNSLPPRKRGRQRGSDRGAAALKPKETRARGASSRECSRGHPPEKKKKKEEEGGAHTRTRGDDLPHPSHYSHPSRPLPPLTALP